MSDINDVELKALVSQQISDDFAYAYRQHGFKSKSECLRYIVEHFLYGCMPHFKHNTKGINSEWQDKG